MTRAIFGVGRSAFFLVMVVAIAVNFARTPPMQSAYDNASAEISSVATAVQENDQPSQAVTEKRKCPCPTEVENADCDEGLCSFGLPAAGIAADAPPLLGVKLLLVNTDLFGKTAEPPVRPPRTIA